MKTGVFKIVAAVSALALFAGCGGSSSESSAAGSVQSGKEVPKSYVISSGNSGGTYYYIAAGQAKILSEKLKDYSFTTESTSGSPVENLTFTSENISTLGFTTLDGLYAAVKGDTTKGFRQAIDNVALIQAGHTLILYCITLSSSGIQTIYDLKGKKISVPTIGNTAYYQAVGILEQYGIALDDVRATPMLYAEAADALKDGSLDAIFIAGGILNPRLRISIPRRT
jgi:TRAP transporter TAXI family solute receptor